MTANQWVFDKWVVWEDERDGTWNVSMDDVGNIEFNIYGGERYAFLFAQHYPALLKAVREYRNCARILLAAPSRINAERYDRSERALNDAMKACEPPAPKKTRRNVIEAALLEAHASGYEARSFDASGDLARILAELDEVEQ